MNNNGLVEYKESFISKIKKVLKKMFGIKEETKTILHQQFSDQTELEDNDFKNSFIEDIKENTNVENTLIEKREFLKEIDGNEEALQMLSVDRLKKLEKYYDNIIKQNNEIIKKLKS